MNRLEELLEKMFLLSAVVCLVMLSLTLMFMVAAISLHVLGVIDASWLWVRTVTVVTP